MSDSINTSAVLGEALLDAIRKAVREELRIVLVRLDGQKNDPVEHTGKAFLTIKEAADFSRLAPSTIRLYIRKRRLRAQQVGRRVIIKRIDLEEFLSANPIATSHD